MKAFTDMGIAVSDVNVNDPLSHKNVIKRVNLYLKRFPEVEYIVDMIASSVIYSSSSNTKKIQCTLRGDYKTLNGSDSTISDSTENVDISVDINDIKVKKIDS